MKIEKKILSDELHNNSSSLISRYQKKVIGEKGLLKLIKYELITMLFCDLPGGLGLFLRKIIYSKLFKKVGKNLSKYGDSRKNQ